MIKTILAHQLPSKRPLHIVLSVVPTLFVGTKPALSNGERSKGQTVKKILQVLIRLPLIAIQLDRSN